MATNKGTTMSYRPDETANLLQVSPGPVKLTPGWESRHSNSDLVNALNKGVNDERPPPDRCNLLFMFMLIHGIGTLMPWNMFITAKEYFTQVKLNLSFVEDTNSTEYHSLYEYNTGFMGYIVIGSQLPNVFCGLLNLFAQFGSKNLGARISGSIIVEIVLFIITTVLAMVDSSRWVTAFFFITITIVVLLGAAGGIYQNSVFGLGAILPGKYTGAIVLGTNVSGTITSLVSILSTFASSSQKTAAIYYFTSALFVLLLCLDTYFALPLLRIYRHYRQKASRDEPALSGRPPYWSVFKQCWFNCVTVFICFFGTLACFPAITSDILAIDSNFIVGPEYFVKVFCFLSFNFFAMVGSSLPMWFKFPSSPRLTSIPVLLRLAFIPFFMFCNYQPSGRQYGVYFSDYAYIGGMVVFALTHGYYSSLTMMYAPRGVHPKYMDIAGMMAAFFLVLGIFIGGNFIFIVRWIMLLPSFA